MVKADIVDLVCEKIGLTRTEAVQIVNKVFNTIKNSLVEGDIVCITGFGTFYISLPNNGIGRRLKAGEEVKINASRTLLFRSSRVMLDIVNSGNDRKDLSKVKKN